MRKISRKPPFSWEHIKGLCEAQTDEEDSLTREMVSCISDKWSLWTMSVIAEQRRPMRFSRIMENVTGVSQKSLTKTLRGLERDGLITRVPDEHDRRRNVVGLTRRGTAALKRLDKRVDAAQRDLLSPLSAADARDLRRLLAQLVDNG